MKLMSYNILDGGETRIPEIIKVIKNESPDYLTINEANSFAKDDFKILKQIAKETNLPYFELALSGEYDYHVAVLSKYKLKNVHKIQPLMRACIVSSIETELGEISIASLHLTPYTEDLRHPEIDAILQFQKQFPKRILMGDMNSLSPHDNYNPDMITGFNEEKVKKFTTDGKLRFDAIEKILSSGYVDSALKLSKNKDITVPTLSAEEIHPKARLDYIFISEPLVPHLQSYKVIKNELSHYSSDHYPIVAELK
ncbi:MAG: hypothetical protein KA035_01975 [Candidatus Levybacteria bacterium]|nr:hypothetical protein [Candidatus Levybacteria bacterium]